MEEVAMLKAEEMAFITINARGSFLRSLQAGFAEVGIMPAHLIEVSPRQRLAKEWRRHRLSLGRRVLLPKLRAMRRRDGEVSLASEEVGYSTPNVWKVNALNSQKTADLMVRLGIRYLINAGAGIFRSPLLDVPGLTIVNAHAGKLPEYRNMNVVEWALYNGDPVVGTVHRIDSGIDTGHIWRQQVLDLSACKSLENAREIAFDRVARMVGPAVLDHARGAIKEMNQDAGEGKSWYVMHSFFRRALDSKMQ